MTIEIDEQLYNDILSILEKRNKTVYKKLKDVKRVEIVVNDTLIQAREIKTKRIKQTIKESIKSLYSQSIEPTKYQINKLTKIAYVTINKYYDEILEEVENENR